VRLLLDDASTPDPVVFDRAQEDGRAIATDNVADFEAVRLEYYLRPPPSPALRSMGETPAR